MSWNVCIARELRGAILRYCTGNTLTVIAWSKSFRGEQFRLS